MIGKEILNYVIETEIGSGGMGRVFLARNKYISQQRVAIKVIHASMVNDYTRERLREEAQHLADLDHPNIVKFVNYHIDDDGNIYLVMEYADGVNLEKYINEVNGLVVEDRVCALFEPILDAFGYAHGKGIIHRDIKPSNIIITTEGIPKVLDFGIAKIIGDESDKDIIVGTPSYMSPEQVRGEDLDQRSDIYSLGVLLHQLMTGNAPYDTTTLSEHEINVKVVNEPLPPMRTFYKYVSDPVQKVVDRATAKAPGDRFADCADFKRTLHRAIYPPKTPRWVWYAASALLLIIAGTCLGIWDYSRTKVSYYTDYVEQWGEPVGIGKLSSSEVAHRARSYRIESSKGKVRRLTLVNSKGKPVSERLRERADRPTDALFYYTPEGKVAKVKVLNQGGRVEHVKVYNDNLKTATFQYDDELGTEMALKAANIGYAAQTDDYRSNQRSRISRHHYTYDDNGHVVKVAYAGSYNSHAHDIDGIYGRTYILDDKGRRIEESYINRDGGSRATKWGLGIKTFHYDDNDNLVKTAYYTIDRTPSLDDPNGTPSYVLTYDEYGNILRSEHRTHEGEYIASKDMETAGIIFEYDKDGNQIYEGYIGIDGNPGYHKEGFAGLVMEYDDNGYSRSLTTVDLDHTPMLNKYNYVTQTGDNDEHGNQLEAIFTDINGNPALFNDCYYRSTMTYDSVGNQTSVFYYDAGNNLVNVPELSDVAGMTLTYDNHGNVIRLANFNQDSVIAPNADGVSVCSKTYDRFGNTTVYAYFDDLECTRPALNANGIARQESEYDDNGNITVIRAFDTEGKPCIDQIDNTSEIRFTYDNDGNQTTRRYFGPDGKPCISREGFHGSDYKYDQHGNITEVINVDLAGKPSRSHFIKRYEYDSNDNQTVELFFDWDGSPALGNEKYHRLETTYNNRNQEIERRYYDTAGKLTGWKNSKISIVRFEYDDKGNTVLTAYFDANDKPEESSEKYASHRSEYDNRGRIVRQLYFGADGQPTDPSVMVPEGITGYDNNGNLNFVASADGNGNYIYNKNIGCAIIRLTFDSKNNPTSRSFFDADDKPMISKTEGIHKVEMEYDSRGNNTAMAFFDAEGKPMKRPSDGVHRVVTAYDDLNRKTSEAYLDGDGNPATDSYGNSRAEYSYSDNSRIISRIKYYNGAGRLSMALRWNGSDWVLDNSFAAPAPSAQNTVPSSTVPSGTETWKEDVRGLGSELPSNLGADYGNLEFTSAKITGANSCEMVFTTEESKYNMSDELLSSYKDMVKALGQQLKKQEGFARVRITVILLDKAQRNIYKTTL